MEVRPYRGRYSQLSTENNQIKYIILHSAEPGEEQDPNQSYISLMEVTSQHPYGKFPEIITPEQYRKYKHSGLNIQLVKERIDNFVRYKKSLHKNIEPSIAVFGARRAPFYNVLEVYNYCVQEINLNYVMLNIAENEGNFFDKIQKE